MHLVGFSIRIYHDAPSPEVKLGTRDLLSIGKLRAVLWQFFTDV